MSRTNQIDKIDLLIMAIAMLMCIALKLLLLHPVGPMVFFDELLYRQGAEAIAYGTRYPSGQYPFLYPLSISPAIALGAGYRGIVLTNLLFTSMLVPACFLLAKEVGMRHPWIAAGAAALMPLQFAFPSQVLSENLFVPAFTWVVWYAVRAKPPTIAGALGFGIAAGSLLLIRYIALPAIPVIFLFWIWGLSCARDKSGVHAPLARLIATSLVGAALVIAAWLTYARFNGIGLQEALGSKASGLATGHLTDKMSAASFTMWATAYAAAAILISGPFLPEILGTINRVLRRPFKGLDCSAFERAALLTVTLLGGYWLVATLHSTGAFYNYPKPQYLIERYLMHVAPLVMVLGLAGLCREKKRREAIGIALISVLLLLLAQAILFRGAMWAFPRWFATIPLYNTDLLPFVDVRVVGLVALLIATSIFLKPRGLVTTTWIIGFFIFQLMCAKAVSEKMSTVLEPVHARALYPVVQEALRSHARVTLVDDVRGLKPRVLRQGLVFWGADPRRITVIQYRPDSIQGLPGDVKYLVTTNATHDKPVLIYSIGNHKGYLYRLPLRDTIPTE